MLPLAPWSQVSPVGAEGVEPSPGPYQGPALPLSHAPVVSSPPCSRGHRAGGIRTPTRRFKRPGCRRYTTTLAIASSRGFQRRLRSMIPLLRLMIRLIERSIGTVGVEPTCSCSQGTRGAVPPHPGPRMITFFQSGRPDSNRRSPAPRAGGFPGFPTSCRVRERFRRSSS